MVLNPNENNANTYNQGQQNEDLKNYLMADLYSGYPIDAAETNQVQGVNVEQGIPEA